MSLTLEITKIDGSVLTKALDAMDARYDVQSGDQFRVLGQDGQPLAGLTAERLGENLVIDGLPDQASLELCDFFVPGEDDQACVLTLPDAQAVTATTTDPMMLAQAKAETKTDVTAGKETMKAKEAMAEKEAMAAKETTAAKEAMAEKEAMASKAAEAKAAEAPAAEVTVAEAAANPAFSTGAIALGTIGLVGVAAAASSSSSDTTTPAVTPPTTEPTPTAAPGGSLEGGDLTITAVEAANGVIVSGSAEAGSTVVITLGTATVQTTAAADGTYTATLDGASLPANGTYPLTVMATGPGDNRSAATTQLGDVTVATSGGGNLAATDAQAVTLTGFDGNDTLVGGNSVAVANGNFDNWDLTGFNSTGPASGLVYDSTTFGTNQSIQMDSVQGNAGQPGIGWGVEFANTPGAGTAIPGIGNVGFNGFEDGGNPGTASNFGRLEFITDATTPGSYTWETVTSGTSGGGGLSQTLTTVGGQSYSVSIDAAVPTGTGQPSDAHQTGGTSIEIRWEGATIAFFDATANGDVGAWVTTGSLVEPTVTGGTWTFANLTAADDTTDLAIIAYEQWAGGPNTAFNDGVGLRISNVSVEGATGAADQTISGGAGADLIYGQDGTDTLYGGTAGTPDTASDTFVFSMAMDNGANTIADFDVTADRIYLVNVSDADTTSSIVPGDTRAFTDGVGGVEGADGTEAAETLNSTGNLTVADLVVGGTQSIAVTETGGNTVLTMTGEGGADLGSVTLTGVTGQVGVDDAASLTALNGAGLLLFTGDAFNNQLINVV